MIKRCIRMVLTLHGETLRHVLHQQDPEYQLTVNNKTHKSRYGACDADSAAAVPLPKSGQCIRKAKRLIVPLSAELYEIPSTLHHTLGSDIDPHFVLAKAL